MEDNGWKKTKENDGKKQCYRKETQRWDFILTVEHHMFCTKGRRSHDILLIEEEVDGLYEKYLADTVNPNGKLLDKFWSI